MAGIRLKETKKKQRTGNGGWMRRELSTMKLLGRQQYPVIFFVVGQSVTLRFVSFCGFLVCWGGVKPKFRGQHDIFRTSAWVDTN